MTTIAPKFLSDPRVQHLFDVLAPAGGAYVVGGAVRDTLLGHDPKDVDFATPATPDTVIAALTAANIPHLPIGLDYGVVGAVLDGEVYEVTTFRKDVATDGRRAVTVWGTDLAEDAQRRDLTINALYLDRDGRVIDTVGGLRDIVDRRVRFVGDAETRIREDRLRALRMFRFWARFGDPDPAVHAEAIAAASRFAGDMSILSRERVGGETLGILMARGARVPVHTMIACGLWEDVLPGSDPDALLAVMAEDSVIPDAGPRLLARLAAAGGDPKTALKAPNALIKEVEAVRATAAMADPAEAAWRFGEEAATYGVFLRNALGLQVPEDAPDLVAKGAEAVFPLRAKDLPELEGKALGTALKAAQRLWLDGGMMATAEELRATLFAEGDTPRLA